MIGEIIFAVIIGIVFGYLLYRLKDIYERRKRSNKIIEKMERQRKRIFKIGKDKFDLEIEFPGEMEVPKKKIQDKKPKVVKDIKNIKARPKPKTKIKK